MSDATISPSHGNAPTPDGTKFGLLDLIYQLRPERGAEKHLVLLTDEAYARSIWRKVRLLTAAMAVANVAVGVYALLVGSNQLAMMALLWLVAGIVFAEMLARTLKPQEVSPEQLALLRTDSSLLYHKAALERPFGQMVVLLEKIRLGLKDEAFRQRLDRLREEFRQAPDVLSAAERDRFVDSWTLEIRRGVELLDRESGEAEAGATRVIVSRPVAPHPRSSPFLEGVQDVFTLWPPAPARPESAAVRISTVIHRMGLVDE